MNDEARERSRRPDSGGGSGDFFRDTSQKVSEGLSHASLGGVADSNEVTAVIEGAVDGIFESGGDPVLGAKAILMGVLQALGHKGEGALATLRNVARVAVRRTLEGGQDPAALAKGLVLGAIAGAKGMDLELEKAATAAAEGALEGAESAREVAQESLRAALKRNIGGIVLALPRGK
jgi:hypothetical protein